LRPSVAAELGYYAFTTRRSVRSPYPPSIVTGLALRRSTGPASHLPAKRNSGDILRTPLAGGAAAMIAQAERAGAGGNTFCGRNILGPSAAGWQFCCDRGLGALFLLFGNAALGSSFYMHEISASTPTPGSETGASGSTQSKQRSKFLFGHRLEAAASRLATFGFYTGLAYFTPILAASSPKPFLLGHAPHRG